MPDDTPYAIADLARLTGLNVRTIRYYIAQGLIPSSGESGPGAHYGQGHLDRLRLTKRLQQQHLPLAEIRQRLAVLSDDEVAGLLETTPEPGAPETSALDYVRSVLGSAPRPVPTASASPPPPASLLAISSAPPMPTGAAGPRFAARIRAAARPAALMSLREAPPSFAPSVPPPDELAAGAAGMPRMRDVPAMDPRLASAETGTAPMAAPLSTEPQPPERSQWERLSLGPNIELHVRRPLSRLEQRRVERLITIARQVLKEDGV